MKKAWKLVLPAMILASGVLLTPRSSIANPDYTKKFRKPCGYCHLGSWDSSKFTEAGIYFHTHGTLNGYVQKPDATQSKDQAKQDNSAPKQQANNQQTKH